MRHSPWLIALAATLTVSALPAQSSQFGVRGLGFPGRGLSARALGAGGAPGMFEPESGVNPAALSRLTATTTSLNMTSSWRSTMNTGGESSGRDTRFPQLSVAGLIPRTRFAVGFSHSMLTDRDYLIISHGVATLRDEALLYTDTTTSRGGISDMRLTASWHVTPSFAIGGGVDFLTGQNQITQRRVWEDTLFLPTRIGGELSFRGMGMTLGAIYQVSPRIALAASVQRLGELEVRQDSLDARTRIPMPLTLTAAVRARITNALAVSGMVRSRSWDRSNEALSANAGNGARSTLEGTGGIELASRRQNADHLPLRLGYRQATLPFPVTPGGEPHERAFTAGTGFRFANQGGGIDFALERVTRREGPNYSERAWLFSIGVVVRTSGGGR